MNKQGGNVLSIILFAISFVMLVAAGVVYLLREDQTSKKWAEQTKVIADQNEKLRAEWQDALNTVKSLCENHNTIAQELIEQKAQLEKLEFAIKTPPKVNGSVELTATQPLVVQFEPLKVRHFKGTPAKKAEKPKQESAISADKKVVDSIKKQMKALQQ